MSQFENIDLAVGTAKLCYSDKNIQGIASEEDKMVTDDDIRWFNSYELLENKQKDNFYITTDFATSVIAEKS